MFKVPINVRPSSIDVTFIIPHTPHRGFKCQCCSSAQGLGVVHCFPDALARGWSEVEQLELELLPIWGAGSAEVGAFKKIPMGFCSFWTLVLKERRQAGKDLGFPLSNLDFTFLMYIHCSLAL